MASSTLSSERSYGVRNLFDSRKEFAWAEGAKSNGVNESISIDFKEETQISALKIFNGFQRSDKYYSANTQLKSTSISNESGQTENVVFQDVQGNQVATLSNPMTGKSYKLTVK